MPKTNIPNYRHHKASGQAFVELGGRRFYLGKYGSKASRGLTNNGSQTTSPTGGKLPLPGQKRVYPAKSWRFIFLNGRNGIMSKMANRPQLLTIAAMRLPCWFSIMGTNRPIISPRFPSYSCKTNGWNKD